MTSEDSLKQLRELKTQVTDTLSGMAEQLADSRVMSFDALLGIARTTGKAELLSKAFAKCEEMPDSPEKAEAMLLLLDEIETRLGVLSAAQSANPSAQRDETGTESTSVE